MKTDGFKVPAAASLLVLLFLVLPNFSLCRETSSPAKLFIVHSYDEKNVCANPQETGLLRELAAQGYRVGENLLIRRFYMRTKRINTTPEQISAQGRLALAMIRTWKPDVVVTLDDNAAHEVMLPLADTEIPVVFSGVNRRPEEYNLEHPFMNRRDAPGHNVTGVVEKLHVEESFQVMREIVPGLRKVVILVDESPTGQAIGEQAAREMSGRGNELQYAIWTARDFAEYRRMIQRINSDPEIGAYYPACSRLPDGSGKMATIPEITAWNLSHCLKPGVAVNFRVARMGMFGGAVMDFSAIGEQAGRKVAAVLAGEPPGNIPVEDARDNALVYNIARARQLGITIPPELLAAASVVYDDMELQVDPVTSRLMIIRCGMDEEEGVLLENGLLTGLAAAGLHPGERFRVERLTPECDAAAGKKRTEILKKITTDAPDLLVLLGDGCVDMFLPSLAGSGIPVLLGGIHAPLSFYEKQYEGSGGKSAAGVKWFAGVSSPYAYVKTLEVVRLILPEAGRLVIFTADSLPWVKSIYREFAAEVSLHRRELGFPDLHFQQVSSMEDLKRKLLACNDRLDVDMISVLFPLALLDGRGNRVSRGELLGWLMANQRKPGFAFSPLDVKRGVLVSAAADPEQVGRRLGRQAFKVLSGTPVSLLSLEEFQESGIYLNRERARRLGIELPISIYEAAIRVYPSTISSPQP